MLFLKHVVSAKGIHRKIRAMSKFPVPTSVRSLQGFLGLASYYHRFVPNFTRIAGPLHMLTRSNVAFVWTTLCQQAFERLTRLLTSPPVLSYPDFSEPFQLHTDASGEGLGAVLEQKSDGVCHPVAFASRTLSKHKQRYGITELETLGVVWGLHHFRAYPDARLPCEDVFSARKTPYQVDLDDYKTELTVGLAEAWRTAQDHLKKAQKGQKRAYDRQAKERKVRVGDRVMVLMPAEQTGKNK